MIKVLVIDDEEICLEQIELFLNGKYQVVKAENGTEGIEILKNDSDIKIVLLDLMMPGLSGTDVLNELNKSLDIDNLNIIMQTGTSNTSELDKAIELGAKSSIIKPFKRKQLIDIIDEYAAA